MTAFDGNGWTSDKFEQTFRFDWTTPPLSLNKRMHRMQEAKITKDLRSLMHAKARHIPDLERCQVELVWYVTDKRRRDDENPITTLKALCDGIVDAEVVPDDTNQYMVKVMPRIVWIDKTVDVAHFELTIKEIL